MSLKLWDVDVNWLFLWSNTVSQAYLWTIPLFTSVEANGFLNGLQSYWKADAVWAFPDEVWWNDWTLIGNAQLDTDWVINWSYLLDFATWDKVTVDWDLTNTSTWSMTIAMWVKQDTTPTWYRSFASRWGASYQFLLRSNFASGNTLQFYCRQNNNSTNASSLSTTALVNWEWTFLVWTFENSDSCQLYINSVADWTWVVPTMPINSNVTSTDISFGWDSGTAWRTLDWRMDEIGFWNRALNQEEIDALYNWGAWMSFDDFTFTDTNISVIKTGIPNPRALIQRDWDDWMLFYNSYSNYQYKFARSDNWELISNVNPSDNEISSIWVTPDEYRQPIMKEWRTVDWEPVAFISSSEEKYSQWNNTIINSMFSFPSDNTNAKREYVYSTSWDNADRVYAQYHIALGWEDYFMSFDNAPTSWWGFTTKYNKVTKILDDVTLSSDMTATDWVRLLSTVLSSSWTWTSYTLRESPQRTHSSINIWNDTIAWSDW